MYNSETLQPYTAGTTLLALDDKDAYDNVIIPYKVHISLFTAEARSTLTI